MVVSETPPIVPVKLTVLPSQMLFELAVAVTLGVGFTVTVELAVLLHPLEFVPVTV
jgi:hypothetical protein